MEFATRKYVDTLRFVEALTGGADVASTYQIIPEVKGCDVRPAVRHGRLTDLWDEFELANLRGACVSICPNETDLCGRRESNIVRARALWLDWDGGDVPVTFDSLAKVLPPSLTVQSKKGQHNYYVLADTDRDINAWRPAQRGLARALGGDVSVADPTKAMRIPGLLHQKSDPFLVTLLQANARRFTLAEVAAAFPAPPEAPKLTSDIDEEEAARRLDATSPAERFRQASYYIENQAPPAIEGSGGRRTALSVVWRLWGFGLDRDTVQSLAETYNDTKCEPPFSQYDIERFVEDGEEIELPGSRLWPLKQAKRGAVSIPGLHLSGVFGTPKF
jgi:hypothetical protein